VNEQLQFTKLIATRLDSARIPYMMTGSMAMAVYAVPRTARDVDLVIDCAPDDSDRVAALFEKDCDVDREAIRAAAESRAAFSVTHTLWAIKAEFIIRKNEPYREIEFGRRRREEVDGVVMSIVSPEDLILSKLIWSKSGASASRLADAQAIGEAAQDLEWSYIETWAARLGVEDLLRRVEVT
jgi:hypothetical protein